MNIGGHFTLDKATQFHFRSSRRPESSWRACDEGEKFNESRNGIRCAITTHHHRHLDLLRRTETSWQSQLRVFDYNPYRDDFWLKDPSFIDPLGKGKSTRHEWQNKAAIAAELGTGIGTYGKAGRTKTAFSTLPVPLEILSTITSPVRSPRSSGVPVRMKDSYSNAVMHARTTS